LGDEVDRYLDQVAAFAEGKINNPGGLSGLGQLPLEMRGELLKRIHSAQPPVRALIYFHFAANGKDKTAAAELDALLKQGAIVGKLRVVSYADLERLAYAVPDMPQVPLRSLAAGMILASRGVRENTGSLVDPLRVLDSRESKTLTEVDRRKAVHLIGWLHLRGAATAASQRALENALKDHDWGVRAKAAGYVGVTNAPQSASCLLKSLRKETDHLALEAKTWALIVGSKYPPEVLWPLVPKLIDVAYEAGVSDKVQQAAVRLLKSTTGADSRAAQSAWWQDKQKELETRKKTAAAKPENPEPPEPKAPPEPGAGLPPVKQDEPKATPAAQKPISPQDETKKKCAQWLLLAKNFFNMKNYDKAEEHLHRVLGACPEGEIAEEAKELLKRVQAMK